MTAPACPLDGKPVHDQAAICAACTADLTQALAEMPALLDDLDLTLSRQTALGERHGGRSSEKALPYDVRASDVSTAARVVLAGWVNVLHDGEERWPDDSPQAMAGWLYDRLERLRRHEAGADAATEIRDLAATARRAVDRAPERWYAGPCGADMPATYGGGFANESCDEELYARVGAARTVCPRCGTEYDVAERRAWLLRHAEDRLLSATDLARALTRLGQEVTPERIRQWKHRGRLIPHAEDTRTGRAISLYRVGDVLDLLQREAAKTAGSAA